MTAVRSALTLAWVLALAWLTAVSSPAWADQVSYEVDNGVQFQVVRRTMQVPITEMKDQTQTVYRQQVTTDTIQHQQLYSVPVTQYQLVSQLHGRWNPFMTPYWTHHYVPVTTWTQQVGTVQIPVNRVAWAPETRTVQAPTTTYRAVDAIVRTPVGQAPSGGGSQPMLASSAPSATLAARPGAATTTAAAPAATSYGGVAMQNDPPKLGTGGWRTPQTGTATATAPSGSYR